jgi:hypothetical protein
VSGCGVGVTGTLERQDVDLDEGDLDLEDLAVWQRLLAGYFGGIGVGVRAGLETGSASLERLGSSVDAELRDLRDAHSRPVVAELERRYAT